MNKNDNNINKKIPQDARPQDTIVKSLSYIKLY